MLYINALEDVDAASYLFKSRKGDGALTVESAHKIIKTTLKELNIKGNYVLIHLEKHSHIIFTPITLKLIQV